MSTKKWFTNYFKRVGLFFVRFVPFVLLIVAFYWSTDKMHLIYGIWKWLSIGTIVLLMGLAFAKNSDLGLTDDSTEGWRFDPDHNRDPALQEWYKGVPLSGSGWTSVDD